MSWIMVNRFNRQCFHGEQDLEFVDCVYKARFTCLKVRVWSDVHENFYFIQAKEKTNIGTFSVQQPSLISLTAHGYTELYFTMNKPGLYQSSYKVIPSWLIICISYQSDNCVYAWSIRLRGGRGFFFSAGSLICWGIYIPWLNRATLTYHHHFNQKRPLWAQTFCASWLFSADCVCVFMSKLSAFL